MGLKAACAASPAGTKATAVVVFVVCLVFEKDSAGLDRTAKKNAALYIARALALMIEWNMGMLSKQGVSIRHTQGPSPPLSPWSLRYFVLVCDSSTYVSTFCLLTARYNNLESLEVFASCWKAFLFLTFQIYSRRIILDVRSIRLAFGVAYDRC